LLIGQTPCHHQRITLVGSTVPSTGADPQAQAALLDQIRTGYGQWLAENAALSFGDGLPGCVIPQLDREQATRDWMGVSLNAVVACMSALMRTDFSAELARVTVPALVVHGDGDAVAPLESCGRRAAELLVPSVGHHLSPLARNPAVPAHLGRRGT
jgi:pimeloyl-ACP methyl ester carboxylesterase